MHTNLLTVKKLITDYELKYGREPGSVQLLAASKGQSIEKMKAAFDAGQCIFGENTLQEALIKMKALSNCLIEWHFIGLIQSNKTRKIAEHFDWVQSITDMKSADRLNRQRPVHLPPLNVCIQVNIHNGSTSAGAGVAMADVARIAADCRSLPRLSLRGLMAIPAMSSDIIKQRKAFRELFLLWQALRAQGIPLDTLSMGMSGDFEAAIAEGSTLVRIGTALFGERQKTKIL